jgi:protein-disulfide isomerase
MLDMLLNLASQAGIDSLRLAACLDSQASRPRVEQDLNEGRKLGVASTPTCFVNGRLVVGASPADYYKAVDEALRASK